MDAIEDFPEVDFSSIKLRVCLVTVFSLYFLFSKTIFLFLRLKNLFGNSKLAENKNCFQNSIYKGN